MAQNPLQQYFRQPKIYIKLPSQGVYNKSGTFQGDPTNMPVYGMTGMDEIILKTPDALLTGESSVKVIESCCPSIKNAWEICILDIAVIFAAIRIATFGNIMEVTHTCSKCSAENDYELDISKIIDHYANFVYDNRIQINDLYITIKPLTYKQSTEFDLKNFRLQQKLQQSEKIEDETQQQQLINDLFKELAVVQSDLYKVYVESVEIDNTVVTDINFISEWLSNCDKSVFDSIKKHIEKNKENWKSPSYPVKCGTCDTEAKLYLELDQSNFFGKA